MKTCSAIAAALSASYTTYSPYVPSVDPLPGFLQQNGVLLSLCLNTKFSLLPPFYRVNCDLKDSMKQLSASWVQQNQTGWRVFSIETLASEDSDEIVELFSVGVILDPTATPIRCLYPYDGATAEREESGCGKVVNQSRAMPWWQKFFYRKAIEVYRRKELSNYTDWDDIPCNVFFRSDDSLGIHQTIAEVLNFPDCSDVSQPDFTYFDDIVLQKAYYDSIMGHSVCTLKNNTPVNIFGRNHFLVYLSKCSWHPDQWNEMLSIQRHFIVGHPEAIMWNEVVLEKPTDIRDVTQAVFFIEHDEMEQAIKRENYLFARREALRLGKHLLRVRNPNDEDRVGPMFECNMTAETMGLPGLRTAIV